MPRHFRRKRLSTVFIVLVVLLVILAGVFTVLYIADQNVKQQKRYTELEDYAKSAMEAQAIQTRNELDAQDAGTDRPEDNQSSLPGIVCWGDSLTSGAGGSGTTYPNVLNALLSDNGYPVKAVNMGVGGEGTQQILARAGAREILLTADLMIPAESRPVTVSLDGNYMRQGSAGMDNVSIAGIAGKLSIRQESYDDPDYDYEFTRDEPGDAVSAPAGTRILNEGAWKYIDCIPIIFIGANGGWGLDPQTLIAQQQAIIDTAGINKDRFVIIGLTAPAYYAGKASAADAAELETALQNHWGEHYINLREHLCDETLLAAMGIDITDADREQIAQGIVPACVRTDAIHLNACGYTLLGQLVFDRLVKLGYIEK